MDLTGVVLTSPVACQVFQGNIRFTTIWEMSYARPRRKKNNQMREEPTGQCEKKKESNLMKICFCLGGITVGLFLGRMIWFKQNVCEQEHVVPSEITSVEQEPKVALGITDSEKRALRQEIEESVRKEFEEKFSKQNEQMSVPQLPAFDERFRIVDFMAQMKDKDPMWQSAMIDNKGDPSLRDVRELFKKIKWYVDFVNSNYPVTKERKK